MKEVISIKPTSPKPCNGPAPSGSRKLTAHGYMKITSTSNNTKRIATRKYFIEKGTLAFPCTSIPHSNVSSFFFVLRIGPSRWVANRVVATNPPATRTVKIIGIKSEAFPEDMPRLFLVFFTNPNVTGCKIRYKFLRKTVFLLNY